MEPKDDKENIMKRALKYLMNKDKGASPLESAGRGAATGMLPFGIQEKAAGLTEKGIAESADLGKTILDKLGLRDKTPEDKAIAETYDKKSISDLSDEHEAQNEAAEEANPEAFMAGELGGEALSSMIPIGGGIKAAGSLSKKMAKYKKAKQAVDELRMRPGTSKKMAEWMRKKDLKARLKDPKYFEDTFDKSALQRNIKPKPSRSRAEINAEFNEVGKQIRETLPLREAKIKRDLAKYKEELGDSNPFEELMDFVREKKKGKPYIDPNDIPTKF